MSKSSVTFTISAVLLLTLEILVLSLSVDAKSLVDTGSLSWGLANSGSILRWLIGSASAFFAFVLLFDKHHSLKAIHIKVASWYYWLFHCLVFVCLASLTLVVFRPATAVQEYLLWAWLFLSILTVASWLSLLFSLLDLFAFCKTNLRFLLLASLIGLFISLSVTFIELIFQPLTAFTLHTTGVLLSHFFVDVYVDSHNSLLALNDFIVHVSTACSGFEGLVIVLSLTSIFLIIQRRELIFPFSLLLLPIAAVLSLIFNIFRVALLMVMGEFISADIAIQGFHSVAGWIAAALVSFLIIFGFSSWKVFYLRGIKTVVTEHSYNSGDSGLSWAILVPFIVFLFITLVTQIFYQGFDYLYPIKTVIVIGLVVYFWKDYSLSLPKHYFEPILVGALVAVLWVFLVPNDPDYNQRFDLALNSMSNTVFWLWLILRLTGFWLLAPIIEELIFRCYIVARLSGKAVSIKNNLDFSLLSVIVSSVLFGFLHTHFLAGLLAGLLFMLVRYRSTNLSAPILAHVIANVGVSVWAMWTGFWIML